MKKEDIKELTSEELLKQIEDDKELYVKLRFNHRIAELENPMKLKRMRKDIARLLTEERKREMAGTLKVGEENEIGKKVTEMEPAKKEKTKEKEVAKKKETIEKKEKTEEKVDKILEKKEDIKSENKEDSSEEK